MEILFDEIPSLDLADFTAGTPAQKAAFVQKLGEAYQNIGFVAIKNHGLSQGLQDRLYGSIKDFFKLPDAIKENYEKPEIGFQRGYTGKGKEHAKGRNTGDLKEFYHVGQELSRIPDTDPIKSEYPPNIWPTELPEFENDANEAYRTLESAGKAMLQAIALSLDLDENFFEDKVAHGNSILRQIHYFPIENPDAVPSDAVRAAEHGDINLITLLMGASADGLQVKRKDGKWIPITALPDQLVVNVGDMLERLTNKKLKSTIHRVVNPPREKMNTSRYSIPFFMHPRSEMDLTCLENCVDTSHPKQYEDITAGEFLEERLRELGLRK
ncbi:isopenicillin N synthase-like dioxygenase [Algoriphagus ratkowskyi]|uniref:Isopenicillin N synthase family oxygenase n=1 Tax=Algoriphagus ratkowskyi TaxID=57028 RepID=A0A2W7RML2_9BACT|nr:2-oxoglutarate and iron-dependent oxygenase domain-containing protein [Algoriphagus ratkowskyi]PZX59730.1 isopenicillin N synthase-like dioxygenase [Algoriphagus ratkowskyi]TXD78554.1 isopenicillin N synthase family oxygenase [Algoriphagus ratkowskyi]